MSSSGLIGRPRNAVPTPSLVLDGAALYANVATMAEWADGRVAIRPHTKTHKCVEIARLQLERGAIGLTTATIAEAQAMLAANPPEILVANEIVDADRIAAAIEIARECRLLLAVDNPANAAALSAAAKAAGVTIDVLLDVDVGLHRCGVRSIPEAVALAQAIAGLGGLRLCGAMGFEGQAMLIEDPGERGAAASGAMDFLAECVAALRANGHTIDIVSGGGTNTYDMTGVHPVITELQVGTYATMDYGYHRLTGEVPADAVRRRDGGQPIRGHGCPQRRHEDGGTRHSAAGPRAGPRHRARGARGAHAGRPRAGAAPAGIPRRAADWLRRGHDQSP